jgi:Protein of unknown function (DUF4230)
VLTAITRSVRALRRRTPTGDPWLYAPNGGLRRRGPNRLLILVLVVAVVAIALWVLARPGLDSPFADREVDRSPPALLRAIEDLSVYKAATGNFQTIVDIEKDSPLLPAAIKGERTVLVAVGSVDAEVDFSRVSRDAIRVSADGRSATITLPRPVLGPARLDTRRSHIASRERGLLDRIGSALGEETEGDRELYLAAEARIAAAAAQSDLVQRAEVNTRAMLTGMLRGLGYESVTVRFVDPPVQR